MKQPPESGPPRPQGGPPPPQGGPPPPQGGPKDRGPSRRKLWLVLAGVGVLITVILLAVGGQDPSQPAPGQPAPSGQNAVQPGKHDPSNRSPAYQQGYEWGNQHMTWADSLIDPAFNCNGEANDRFNVARRDLPDWDQGCVDGLKDQPAEPGATP